MISKYMGESAHEQMVNVQAVEERAEQLRGRAENVSKSASADSPPEQAAAQVEQAVIDAAPEEDLGGSLSVLQGADSKLEGQKEPQVPDLPDCHSAVAQYCRN